MESRSMGDLTLYYPAEERDAAEVIGRACEQSVALVHVLWGLEAPAACRVYVMTSWLPFLFHSAPWPWRIYLALTLPLRYARLQKLWLVAGGWAQRYGKRQVVGIKPARLLQAAGAGLRARIFLPREADEWVAHNTCHELVHACSEGLKLPTWLHEGLAMVTVDHLAGRATVRDDTLAVLASQSQETRPEEDYGRVPAGADGLVYLAVRGYWLTRYLADRHPALLRKLLAGRQPHEALERRLAAGLGLSPETLWRQIDGMVVSHYQA